VIVRPNRIRPTFYFCQEKSEDSAIGKSSEGVIMNIQYAKELLEMLADGVNPVTGEVLSADDSCNQPEVIRALHLAVAQLEKAAQKAKYLPANAGKPWTAEDEENLCRMFNKGCSKKEICGFFKRTEGAIAARLVQLGLIQSRDDFRIIK